MITANFAYCPNCGHPYETPNVFPLKCISCTAAQYQNSKPSCALLIVQEGHVLLAKRARDPHKGAFDVPGGFLEFGETPEAASIREAKEELGVEIEVQKYVGAYTSDYVPGIKTLDIFFLAKIISGTPTPHDDVAELVWLPIAQLNKPISPFAGIQQGLNQLYTSYHKN